MFIISSTFFFFSSVLPSLMDSKLSFCFSWRAKANVDRYANLHLNTYSERLELYFLAHNLNALPQAPKHTALLKITRNFSSGQGNYHNQRCQVRIAVWLQCLAWLHFSGVMSRRPFICFFSCLDTHANARLTVRVCVSVCISRLK